jgi:hypothetical protein
MKRFTTIVFAALVALTLSMPVWAQTPPATNGQTKTTEKPAKGDKKQTKKEKKAKKQSNKDANKNSTNTNTK